MAFVPVIDFCLSSDIEGNHTLIVTDKTDVYHAANNPTGWNNATTLLVGDLTEATITITYTDSNNNIITTTTDVLNQIDNPVEGIFSFNPFVFNGDGIYLVDYTLKTEEDTFKVCKQKILYPEVSCCISKKLSKLSSNLDNVKLYEKVVKLKTFEKVLFTASKTVDSITAMKVLNTMEKLCASDCGCGC